MGVYSSGRSRAFFPLVGISNRHPFQSDEATAHLDSGAERAIQQAFETAVAGRTSLAIAHRRSTVQAADQILVLQQGRIVERGRHEDLLRAGNLYAQLYEKQFKAPPKA